MINRVVYKTTNLINNKIYVGQDTYNRPYYLGSGKILRNALKKYGKCNFFKEILCECKTAKELDEMEIYWIEKLSSRNPLIGYNIQKGGKGQSNEEYLKRMSQSLSGKNNPMYGKSILDIWILRYGEVEAKKKWEESNRRRSINGKGKLHTKFSDEALKNLSNLRKGKSSCRKKKVCINDIIYDSMYSAAKTLNVSISSISGKCNSTDEKFKNYKICQI